MNGTDFNKREKRDTEASCQIQSNYGRAEVRKIGSGINVSFEGGDVAGKQSLVYQSNLQARQTHSLANTQVNYEESRRLEDQRIGTELYSVRCYDCD